LLGLFRRGNSRGTHRRSTFHEIGLLAGGISPVNDPFCDCLIKTRHRLWQQLVDLSDIFCINGCTGLFQERSQTRPDCDVSLPALLRLFHAFGRGTMGWHFANPLVVRQVDRLKDFTLRGTRRCRSQKVYCRITGGILPDCRQFVNGIGLPDGACTMGQISADTGGRAQVHGAFLKHSGLG